MNQAVTNFLVGVYHKALEKGYSDQEAKTIANGALQKKMQQAQRRKSLVDGIKSLVRREVVAGIKALVAHQKSRGQKSLEAPAPAPDAEQYKALAEVVLNQQKALDELTKNLSNLSNGD